MLRGCELHPRAEPQKRSSNRGISPTVSEFAGKISARMHLVDAIEAIHSPNPLTFQTDVLFGVRQMNQPRPWSGRLR